MNSFDFGFDEGFDIGGDLITQRPNQNGVWVAAKNPVIYKMIRKDYTWVAIFNSAGNAQIQLSGASDLTADFTAGITFWLQADDGSYSSLATVVSSSYVGVTLIVTDVPYTTNTPPGYINLVSQRPNYYLNIGLYRSTDNTLIGAVNYYPSTIGLTTIDVSQLLLSVLYPGISSIVDGIILQDSNTTEGFYIKYTEVFTGSSEASADDSANVSYGIYGAKQIGQDSYYASYLNTAALTKFDRLQLWSGEYYCLSWIWEGGTTNWLKKSWYDNAGVLLCSTLLKNTNNTTPYSGASVPASVYTFMQKFSLSDTIALDRNFTGSGTIAWTSNSLTLSTGTVSKLWSGPIFVTANTSISYTLTYTITGGSSTVRIQPLDTSGSVIIGGANLGLVAAGTYTTSGTITPTSDAYFLGVDFSNSSGSNSTLTITLSVTVSSSANRIDFKGISLNATTYSESSVVFGVISGYIQPCGKNPVTIFWRNKLGGESSWTFNYNQDLVQKLQEPFINTWKTVFDNNLTLAQFNALNELFGVGQTYQTPLIELTTSIDKTEARMGQQVYIIDSSGNKTGVIVIGSENKTQTKRNKHNFQATIELPEIFG